VPDTTHACPWRHTHGVLTSTCRSHRHHSPGRSASTQHAPCMHAARSCADLWWRLQPHHATCHLLHTRLHLLLLLHLLLHLLWPAVTRELLHQQRLSTHVGAPRGRAPAHWHAPTHGSSARRAPTGRKRGIPSSARKGSYARRRQRALSRSSSSRSLLRGGCLGRLLGSGTSAAAAGGARLACLGGCVSLCCLGLVVLPDLLRYIQSGIRQAAASRRVSERARGPGWEVT
jgi:hypothetical protein